MAHTLPELGYAYDALEPSIDARTMEIHHSKHHQAYITNLNNAIAGKADLEAKSICELIGDLAAVPEDIRAYPLLRIAMLMYLLVPGVFMGVSLLATLYLQQVLGMTASGAGSLMLPNPTR